MDAATERKLTTILSADVAGYSRLVEADEPGTLARKAYREAIVKKVAGHRGRGCRPAGAGAPDGRACRPTPRHRHTSQARPSSPHAFG